MMNLVLVLVIAVVSRPSAHIRQRLPLAQHAGKLLPLDRPVPILVQKRRQLIDYLPTALLRNALVRLIEEAIGGQHLLRLPDAVAVEVVEREEGRGVPLIEVVLLYYAIVSLTVAGYEKVVPRCSLTGHVFRHPVCVRRYGGFGVSGALVAVVAVRVSGGQQDGGGEEYAHLGGIGRWNVSDGRATAIDRR